MSKEGCVGCGRPTQPGTPLFSDRRSTALQDGTRVHLCGDCNERAASQFGRRPTEADMRAIAARGSGIGYF